MVKRKPGVMDLMDDYMLLSSHNGYRLVGLMDYLLF